MINRRICPAYAPGRFPQDPFVVEADKLHQARRPDGVAVCGAACAHTIDTLQGVAVRSTPVDAGANHLGELVTGTSLHLSTHLLKDNGVGLLNRRIERSALRRRLN